MVDAVVSFVVERLGDLLIEQVVLLRGKEINTLKDKLNEIQRNREIFNTGNIGDARLGSDRMNETTNWLRRERPYEDNDHVVGFKEDADKLMFELIREVKDRYVISIVGTGGLGKTTIARKLYNTLSSTNKFDCHAWVSVSNDYNIQDLLRATIKSFKKEITTEEFNLLEKMNKDDLESYARDYLKGRRYLVVLDDVWDVNSWESLRRAFPNENNGNRVIMTTRNKVVAEHCDERTYVHELPFLKDEESWELFCSKAFPNYDNEIGNKKNPDEWPKLKEHIWCHVRDDSIHVEHIMALSFNDLPYFLKSCFLYLGLFPEDFGIDAERLYRLWVAEGFIKRDEEPFEEKAEAYLKELIDRSLIQVVERNWKRITTCRVHDLLRDFAIEKSKELNFLHIYEGSLAPSSRRLPSHCGFQRFVSLDHSDSRLRTLLFFNLEGESMEIAQLQSLCRKLRLLRVLDLKGLPFNPPQETEKTRLPDEIGKLIRLRYLSLHSTKLNDLSPFIELSVEGQMEFNSMDLINLRELHVCFRGDGSRFTLDPIGGLRSLQCLDLQVLRGDSDWPFPTLILHLLSQCQHLVQLRLQIFRHWELPTEVREFPLNLKYLYLDASYLSEDPMPMLERLPKLKILIFLGYYGKNILACTARGFPQLEILQLMHGKAEEFRVEEGGMPMLMGFLLLNFRVNSIADRLRSVPKPHPPLDIFKWAF
ncbi:hypothetical protein C3L33_17640, partial [Rhododendron williamsianum]